MNVKVFIPVWNLMRQRIEFNETKMTHDYSVASTLSINKLDFRHRSLVSSLMMPTTVNVQFRSFDINDTKKRRSSMIT